MLSARLALPSRLATRTLLHHPPHRFASTAPSSAAPQADPVRLVAGAGTLLLVAGSWTYFLTRPSSVIEPAPAHFVSRSAGMEAERLY
ncbi:hypothetical protein JCM6882_009204 [Rhodosporidiobolus microsporus]